jgi:hypothetical protein
MLTIAIEDEAPHPPGAWLVFEAAATGSASRDGVTVTRTALGWTVAWPGGEVWCDCASEAVHRATQALSRSLAAVEVP